MGRKSGIARMIIEVIGVTGLVVAVLAFPGLGGALVPFLKNKKYSRNQIRQNLGHLINQDMVDLSRENGRTVFKLTEKGRKKLSGFKLMT